jgi:glycosyltransferase involved in cell wall biosynthesis
MKIAQIAPLWERVPPPAYGGTEAVVSLLTEELVRRGHRVELFASGDSITSARLHAVYHRSLRTADDLQYPAPYEWVHAASAIAAADCDVVHNHAGELVMAMAELTRVPMLTTMHCLVTPDTRFVWERYRGAYVTISHAAYRAMPRFEQAQYLGVVYNAVDVDSFPFRARKDDYLLYLSRISPEKGTHLAIEVARRLGRRLIVAGKVDRADRRYFHEVVCPLLQHRNVEFVGEVTREQAKELFVAAEALLLPLQWEEPFGLVMAESMACGTPVVAFPRGAAPEIVRHGVTGFLVDDLDAMVRAVYSLDRIDPAACRRHVAERFDVGRMVDGYLRCYERLLERSLRRYWPVVVGPVDGDRWTGSAGERGGILTH